MHSHSSQLEVHLPSIIFNLNLARAHVGQNTKITPVVKCDAYGLGAVEIAKALERAGCDEIYVATAEEGVDLRAIGINSKLFIIHGFSTLEEARVCYEHHLTPVLNNINQIQLWQQLATELGVALECSVHIDTGMTRLGLPYSESLNALQSWPKELKLEYIMSHLACADEKDHPMNSEQLQRFQAIKEKFPSYKYSLANSAGMFLGSDFHFDQIRPGVFLYGVDSSKSVPVKPVVYLSSRIIGLYDIKDQTSIGYSATYKLTQGMKTATVSFGYGDGYLRSLSNKGFCYIQSHKAPIIGRVSMDVLCVDVSNIPAELLYIGQQVELLGNNVSIEQMASMAGVINHEVISALQQRRCNVEYVEIHVRAI